MSQYSNNLNLLQSAITLRDNIEKDVKLFISKYGVKRKFFYTELGISDIKFYRKMKGITPWSMEELVELLKIIVKLEKSSKQK